MIYVMNKAETGISKKPKAKPANKLKNTSLRQKTGRKNVNRTIQITKILGRGMKIRQMNYSLYNHSLWTRWRKYFTVSNISMTQGSDRI